MPVGLALVDVGLAVGDDDHLVAAQLRAQQRAQAVRVPLGLRPERAAVFVLEVAQPRAQLGGERRELGRRRQQRPQQALAAQDGAHAR